METLQGHMQVVTPAVLSALWLTNLQWSMLFPILEVRKQAQKSLSGFPRHTASVTVAVAERPVLELRTV